MDHLNNILYQRLIQKLILYILLALVILIVVSQNYYRDAVGEESPLGNSRMHLSSLRFSQGCN
jgi:hypothetical protein